MSEDEKQDDPGRANVNYGPGSNARRTKSAGPYLAIIAVLAIGLGVCLYLLATQMNNGSSSAPGNDAPAQQDASASADNNVVDVDKINGTAPATGDAPAEAQTEGDGTDAAQQGQTIDPDSILSKMAQTLSAYYSASSPEEKLKYVIDPERIQPLMRDFYFRHPIVSMPIESMTPPQNFAFGGQSFWRVQVTFKNGATGFAALRVIDGEPKVDWESEVRYSSRDWNSWVDDQTEPEGDFRVYAILDQYYPPEFSDRERYVCIKLRTMDSTRTVFAYLDAKDLEQRELIEQMAQGNMQECTLRLKRVNSDAPSAIARVVKVLSTSWIVVGDES